MNDNEAGAAENPDSLTAPAQKGIPLASAFHQPTPAASSMPEVPRDAVLPRKTVVVRHPQRVLTRSFAFRTRRRLLDRRLARRDRGAAQRARRPRTSQSDFLDALRTALSTPGIVIQNAIANMMAPIRHMQRMIAEMVRPSWLQVLQQTQETVQRLVQDPMLTALRWIREHVAGSTWPALGAIQRIRDAITGTSTWLTGAVRRTRAWASGFMTYQAKLQQPINTMFSSWSWKLHDITTFLAPITNILTAVRSIEWPGFSSLTEALTQLVIRGIFWAAVRVRKAIIHEENSEEIVRDFMLQVLNLFPQSDRHVDAAKEALLEDDWMSAEPENVKKMLRKRITDLHRNYRLIGDTELGNHHIVSLQAPSARARSDNGMILTLEDALSDPHSVEDLVLGLPEFRDSRIDRVLTKLKPGEREVVDLYARHDGMTWDRAAAAVGQPPAYGERVRRKLHRLGNEFDRRQASGLQVPTTTRPRTKPAFG